MTNYDVQFEFTDVIRISWNYLIIFNINSKAKFTINVISSKYPNVRIFQDQIIANTLYFTYYLSIKNDENTCHDSHIIVETYTVENIQNPIYLKIFHGFVR